MDVGIGAEWETSVEGARKVEVWESPASGLELGGTILNGFLLRAALASEISFLFASFPFC